MRILSKGIYSMLEQNPDLFIILVSVQLFIGPDQELC